MTTPGPVARPITTRPGFGLRWRTLARVALRMMLHDKLKMAGTPLGRRVRGAAVEPAGRHLDGPAQQERHVRAEGRSSWEASEHQSG